MSKKVNKKISKKVTKGSFIRHFFRIGIVLTGIVFILLTWLFEFLFKLTGIFQISKFIVSLITFIIMCIVAIGIEYYQYKKSKNKHLYIQTKIWDSMIDCIYSISGTIIILILLLIM